MRIINADRLEPLFDTAATRSIEQAAQAALPHHTLMARAGLAVARLAQALAPHARCIWVACGPGNNGGDGLVAATHLHTWAQKSGSALRVVVTHAVAEGDALSRLPPDARQALASAQAAGVTFQTGPPDDADLAIDALLGIGAIRPLTGTLATWLAMLRTSAKPVLCVDLPSGLHADTGALAGTEHDTSESAAATQAGPRHTLSLLSLKPGLFTGQGRDAAGQVWFDDLGATPAADVPVTAWLSGQATHANAKVTMPHGSHKGSFGDVVVVGGQGVATTGAGMTGAAVLAARAALHAGAGRVFVGLLEAGSLNETTWDPVCPEVMFRRPQTLLDTPLLRRASVVCGCGGGALVAAMLPRVLSQAATLVLDADALNAVAQDTSLQAQLTHRQGRGWITVLTPHPLEAARLLGTHTALIMSDRLQAAHKIATRFGAICVLKGSGTVIAAPTGIPRINSTGNAALATAGTGDVLAGMIGSALAQPVSSTATALDRVVSAVFQHGWLADHWNDGQQVAQRTSLMAGELAQRARPIV
ncbi:NAD(P)H-hydrate dehydratase [Hydrogenophaga sp. PBL-H3]|uniref:NAD(P)H-hydrate dehydratase n=1 Tax=Hydrogenophaga sp. PBL-H3 TaxID=434010 RepID=UPI00131F640F|nr:NAD(P)H-hydrate dehydratase [Hydrogenophaga sp. PBL-H3]QHE76322.1 NAD(P)H-hydrate dehydratase [Hydrogenophaga sp. PBL-H3]QHE80746.1 NAD(P)H-hydrate dehydratase [Hydrogenophaga sp. PBL-H3]